MTASLDAYRSDREQLLARVRELEAEVERLSGSDHFRWLQKCPACGTREMDGVLDPKDGKTWQGWVYPQACISFWQRLACWFSHNYRSKPHMHQRCTACGARWVVDAEGWKFG